MKTKHTKLLLLALLIAVIVAARLSPLGSALTFENLKQNREVLVAQVHDHYGMSVAVFILSYILVAALSIPGVVILTLAGGFLFGTLQTAGYVNVGATVGATLSFLSARYLLGGRIQEKYQPQLMKFNKEIEQNGAGYLLTLRLIPVFPFFLINFLSGLTTIRLRTFIWTTSLGVAPGSAVFAFAGKQLGSINTVSEILSAKVLAAFGLLAAFALFPVVLKRIKAARKRRDG